MCRNIRPLFNFDPPASDAEVHDAALQFVRKLAGTRRPSRRNAAAFDKAVVTIAAAAREMIDAMETSQPPKSREVEAAKARLRAAARTA